MSNKPPYVPDIGEESRLAIASFSDESLFDLTADEAESLTEIVRSCGASEWEDQECARLLDLLREARDRQPRLLERTASQVERTHSRRAEAAFECLSTTAPANYEILDLLSDEGKHKLVFLASTGSRTGRVVLKKLRTDDDLRALQRDLVPRTDTAHLISTDVVQNAKGEFFLVEQELDQVVDSSYQISGDEEAANMLHEIALGLNELHETSGLAHNDVKPGNIGILDSYFTLIDLGSCTPLGMPFEETKYGRGDPSIRAPELLGGDRGADRSLSDVWSLGAVIHYFVAGRYPLMDSNETVPDRSLPNERDEFVSELARRAESEWSRFQPTGETELLGLLSRMLEPDPARRIKSQEVPHEAARVLGSKLRSTFGHRALRPPDELAAILGNLPAAGDAVSVFTVRRLAARLRELQALSGWDDERRAAISAALVQLGSVHERRDEIS